MAIWMFAILFTAVSAGAFIALSQNEKPLSTTSRADSNSLPALPPVKKTQTQKEPALKEYSDPSGFRFLYPSNVSLVTELDDSDSTLFSSIRIKSQSEGGYISIKVTSSNFTKLEDWLKANGISKNSPDLEKIKLGDIDAYQTMYQKQKITGALDSGAVITIVNTDPESAVLTKAYDSVISTFAFYQPQESSSVDEQSTETPASPSEDTTESDEVIE